MLIEKGQASGLTTRVEVAQQVKAPVEDGQQQSTLCLLADCTIIATIPLVAPEAVERLSWWDVTRALVEGLFFAPQPESI